MSGSAAMDKTSEKTSSSSLPSEGLALTFRLAVAGLLLLCICLLLTWWWSPTIFEHLQLIREQGAHWFREAGPAFALTFSYPLFATLEAANPQLLSSILL